MPFYLKSVNFRIFARNPFNLLLLHPSYFHKFPKLQKNHQPKKKKEDDNSLTLAFIRLQWDSLFPYQVFLMTAAPRCPKGRIQVSKNQF